MEQSLNTSSQGTRTLKALTSPFLGFVINPKSKATSDKFKRLRDRGFLTKDGNINIMIVKSSWNDFKNMLPSPDKSLLDEFAKYALEQTMIQAKQYPPQIQDRFVYDFMDWDIGNTVAMMVLDELYDSRTFRALNEQEKVTANLLMFADKLLE